MTLQAKGAVLQPGDIVYFDFLHLGTAYRISGSSNRVCEPPNVRQAPQKLSGEGTSSGSTGGGCTYEVQGKRRPLLILYPMGQEFGIQWYRVLKLTSEKKDRKDWRWKNGYVPLGEILKKGVISYAERDPHTYPHNLIINKIKNIPKLALNDVMKLIGQYSMGEKSQPSIPRQ